MDRMPWEHVVTIHLQNAFSYLPWLELDKKKAEYYGTIFEDDILGDMDWDEWVEGLVVDQMRKAMSRLDMIFLM